MNADVKVVLREDDDSECADIRIRSWGAITELRFKNFTLSGVAIFSSMDLNRLFGTIKEAERQRVDPDPKMLACIEYVMDRIDYHDEDKSRLYINVEAEMPVATGESVLLTPNPKMMEFPDDESQRI